MEKVMEDKLVSLINASKIFADGKESHRVLDNVDFQVSRGESTALTGTSGSGKSTILNIIAGFEPLTDGELWLNNENTESWNDQQWSHFRFQTLGIIFQQFNLLTPLNVRQNIAFPLSLNRQPWDSWCDHLVDILQIRTLLDRHVSSLSGGQQQRVAIARALAHKPQLLLADEPTGNLDHNAGIEVMRLLNELIEECNTALILVTHSQECADFMHTHYHLLNGQLIESNNKDEPYYATI